MTFPDLKKLKKQQSSKKMLDETIIEDQRPQAKTEKIEIREQISASDLKVLINGKELDILDADRDQILQIVEKGIKYYTRRIENIDHIPYDTVSIGMDYKYLVVPPDLNRSKTNFKELEHRPNKPHRKRLRHPKEGYKITLFKALSLSTIKTITLVDSSSKRSKTIRSGGKYCLLTEANKEDRKIEKNYKKKLSQCKLYLTGINSNTVNVGGFNISVSLQGTDIMLYIDQIFIACIGKILAVKGKEPRFEIGVKKWSESNYLTHASEILAVVRDHHHTLDELQKNLKNIYRDIKDVLIFTDVNTSNQRVRVTRKQKTKLEYIDFILKDREYVKWSYMKHNSIREFNNLQEQKKILDEKTKILDSYDYDPSELDDIESILSEIKSKREVLEDMRIRLKSHLHYDANEDKLSVISEALLDNQSLLSEILRVEDKIDSLRDEAKNHPLSSSHRRIREAINKAESQRNLVNNLIFFTNYSKDILNWVYRQLNTGKAIELSKEIKKTLDTNDYVSKKIPSHNKLSNSNINRKLAWLMGYLSDKGYNHKDGYIVKLTTPTGGKIGSEKIEMIMNYDKYSKNRILSGYKKPIKQFRSDLILILRELQLTSLIKVVVLKKD